MEGLLKILGPLEKIGVVSSEFWGLLKKFGGSSQNLRVLGKILGGLLKIWGSSKKLGASEPRWGVLKILGSPYEIWEFFSKFGDSPPNLGSHLKIVRFLPPNLGFFLQI